MQRMIRVAILNAECIQSRENITFAAKIAHLKKIHRLGEENIHFTTKYSLSY